MKNIYLEIIYVLFLSWIQDSLQLVCNYCYQADLKEDCHLNVIHCQAEHVCSVETSVIYYGRQREDETKKYMMYKMGCEHYSLCRDRVSSGVGPYGYSVDTNICCCSHRCEEPDGVGKGNIDHCPMLWDNYTQVISGVGIHSETNWIFLWIALVLKSIL